MITKRENIADYYRSSAFDAFDLRVSGFGLPILYGWDVILEDYNSFYLDQEVAKLLLSNKRIVDSLQRLGVLKNVHSDVLLDDEDLYFHLGNALTLLSNEGTRFAYLRGSEVSLDRMVQL